MTAMDRAPDLRSTLRQSGMPTIALALAVVAFGAGGLAARLMMNPGASCHAGSTSFARLELLFGTSRRGGSEIGDTEWQAFLDAEVTPRFPDGLTVFTGYGQWRNAEGRVVKEASRMLVIWHQPAADSEVKIEAIRAAYKARFHQESVMRVDGRSCVSF